MIRAKDFETLLDSLNHLGLPLKEILEKEKIDPKSKEMNCIIFDASQSESPIYRLRIKEENTGEFVIHDYEARMLVVAIEHGFYEGIDTLKLENQMKEIKWALFPVYDKEGLAKFFYSIDRLRGSNDWKANQIGDKLAVKYFSNTPLEEILPLPDKKPYEKKILIPIHNNGNDVDFREAVQLLRGEAIIKYVDSNKEGVELCWLKEDSGYLKYYPDFNVAETFKQMPFVKQPDVIEISEIIAGFGDGKPYETSLLINRRIQEGTISVNPGDKTLDFRDKSGRSVNWKLWTNLNQNKNPGKGKKGPGL